MASDFTQRETGYTEVFKSTYPDFPFKWEDYEKMWMKDINEITLCTCPTCRVLFYATPELLFFFDKDIEWNGESCLLCHKGAVSFQVIDSWSQPIPEEIVDENGEVHYLGDENEMPEVIFLEEAKKEHDDELFQELTPAEKRKQKVKEKITGKKSNMIDMNNLTLF